MNIRPVICFLIFKHLTNNKYFLQITINDFVTLFSKFTHGFIIVQFKSLF